MNPLKLLSFLSAVNQDGRTSISNVAVMVTVAVNALEPSVYSVIALALAFLNYNAKRFAILYFGKRDNEQLQRLQRVEDELKALISMNELRKISR